MDNGILTSIRNRYEDVSRHYIIRVQGSRWYICTFYGHWGIVRSDGWHLSSSTSRKVPPCEIL